MNVRFPLPADLTLDSAVAVRRGALDALAARPGPWVIDASALRTFDSACLALLLELRRAAPEGALRIESPPQRLQDLAAAYGVAFVIDDTGTSAVARHQTAEPR